MRTATTMMRAALAMALSACVYDGEGTKGLPCNVDSECSALQCVEKVCGGPQDGATDESGGDESDAGRPPTEQIFDDPCTPGQRECIGPNSIRFCDDNAKLRTYQCEHECGEGNPVDGGCRTDPDDGLDYCFCEN